MSPDPDQRIEPLAYQPPEDRRHPYRGWLLGGLLAATLVGLLWWQQATPPAATPELAQTVTSPEEPADERTDSPAATPDEPPAEPPPPTPEMLRSTLKLSSIPSGASVTIDGEFRGQTPVDIELEPGQKSTLLLSRAGHSSDERQLTLDRGQTRELEVRLRPILGTIELTLEPADAVIFVDGQKQTDTTLELPARPHRLEVSREGFQPFQQTLTPQPDYKQRLTIRLESEAVARLAATPSTIRSSGGPSLNLIQPGRITLGSARGTQGRQSNETMRPVRLTRAFYLGTHEVSNAQFRRFQPGHSSGIAYRKTLDNDTQPVVRVPWQLAARYCNWLSEADGLPAAYLIRGREVRLAQPATQGYRLPSEAEWAFAARVAGNASALRYPWGDAMPPPSQAGNFADRSARQFLPKHLANYDDGYPVSAPVGRFAANAVGLYDLGGNVAEWVHDYYSPPEPVTAKEVEDPFGPETGTEHVIRGSSWQHGRITQLRLAYRDRGDGPREDVGFRIARYAKAVDQHDGTASAR